MRTLNLSTDQIAQQIQHIMLFITWNCAAAHPGQLSLLPSTDVTMINIYQLSPKTE